MAILKKASAYLKYAFMHKNSPIFSISAMSRVLDVSRSGYYAWIGRPGKPSARARRREQLDERVVKAYEAR